MPATWVTPRVWVAAERVGASKMNEISTDLGVLYPYTTAGDLAYRDAAGAYLSRLAIGAAGQQLGVAAGIPAWVDGVPGIFTAAGDLVYGTGADAAARLAKGTARAKLRMNVAGTLPEWVDTIICQVGRTTNLTVTNAAYVQVVWDSEIADIGGVWAAGAPSRFTIPRTGWYMIGAKVEFAVDANGTRELQIYKNGAPTYYAAGGQPSSSLVAYLNAIGQFYATAGDYFEFYVYQNSGDSLLYLPANRCFAWLFDLGL